MLSGKELFELIQKNPGVGVIYVDELHDLSNDPFVLRKSKEIRPYLRPECFPPGFQHLGIKSDEDLSSKD